MLADPAWREWNNSAIARQCRVSEFLGRTVRQERAPTPETQEPPERTRKVTRGGKTYTMRTGCIGTAARTKAPAALSPARSPAPAAPVVPFESGGSDTADVSASVSSMASKIDTAVAGVPQPHQEETPPPPMAATTADGAPPAPTIPPPPPSLMDAWQQANDDERTAFVARYRDEIFLLLAAHDEQQPTKRRERFSAYPAATATAEAETCSSEQAVRTSSLCVPQSYDSWYEARDSGSWRATEQLRKAVPILPTTQDTGAAALLGYRQPAGP
jgi:hypothetical protein